MTYGSCLAADRLVRRRGKVTTGGEQGSHESSFVRVLVRLPRSVPLSDVAHQPEIHGPIPWTDRPYQPRARCQTSPPDGRRSRIESGNAYSKRGGTFVVALDLFQNSRHERAREIVSKPFVCRICRRTQTRPCSTATASRDRRSPRHLRSRSSSRQPGSMPRRRTTSICTRAPSTSRSCNAARRTAPATEQLFGLGRSPGIPPNAESSRPSADAYGLPLGRQSDRFGPPTGGPQVHESGGRR
jgi:hypothetical protein